MIIASRLSLVSRLFIITRNMGCYRSENTFTLISLDFNFAYLPVLNIYIFVIFYNYILYIHTRRNAAEISIDLNLFIYIYIVPTIITREYAECNVKNTFISLKYT